MNLDIATKRIELVLGEAMTTAECDWVAAYATVAPGGFLLGASDGTTNGTTAVVAVAGPPVGQYRQVKEVRLHNSDTITHQVTLQLNNAGTIRIVTSQSIPAGGDFLYTVDSGVAASGGSAPAILVESGAAAKISALPAFDLAAPPDGSEPLPAVEGGATVQVTLAQLYTLFAAWLDYVATSPLDAPGGGGNDGLPILIQAGTGDGVGAGGSLTLQAGIGGTAGAGGEVAISAGDADGGNNVGGGLVLNAGHGTGTGAGGEVNFFGGAGSGTTGSGGGNATFVAGNASGGDSDGGNFLLRGGTSTGTGFGGGLALVGGTATDPGGTGGSVQIDAGAGTTPGQVLMPSLPTSDPGVSGALWVSAGALQVSP